MNLASLRVGLNFVGRDESCDVLVHDPYVSARHLRVRFDGQRYFVRDESTNGTVLNATRLPANAEQPFRLGDVLHFGSFCQATLEEERPSERTAVPTLRTGDDAFEAIAAANIDGVTSTLAVLVFHAGPQAGQEVPLLASSVTLGGPEATVDLGPAYRDAPVAKLSVTEGNVLLEPDGRSLTHRGAVIHRPRAVHASNQFQVGPHVFSFARRQVKTHTPESDAVGELVGRSVAMRRVFGLIRRLAPHDMPVLILGETGTGKEFAAKAVHELSRRRATDLVVINCASLEPTLADSELFGHVKGAFTGAVADKVGAFHAADGGTLFLDEIGELPLPVQAKLLRVLESGEVRRVGETKARTVNVRVIAATHRDLGNFSVFREDLLARLSAAVVALPPLRRRPDDLQLLVDALLTRHHPGVEISFEARRVLANHTWPGNVRELRQLLARAVALCPDATIEADHVLFTHALLGEARGDEPPTRVTPPPPPLPAGLETITPIDGALNPHLGSVHDYTAEELRLLCRARGERGAAKVLGLSKSGLRHHLQRWGLVGSESAPGSGRPRTQPPASRRRKKPADSEPPAR